MSAFIQARGTQFPDEPKSRWSTTTMRASLSNYELLGSVKGTRRIPFNVDASIINATSFDANSWRRDSGMLKSKAPFGSHSWNANRVICLIRAGLRWNTSNSALARSKQSILASHRRKKYGIPLSSTGKSVKVRSASAPTRLTNRVENGPRTPGQRYESQSVASEYPTVTATLLG